MNEGERILLVDDTPTNLQVLFQTLDGRGYELLIAQSGEEALALAAEAQPALILLDIMMPGIDGFETCRRLKAIPATQEQPVIFMSALSETKDKVKGLELGAVDYITKPFRAEEVIARVNTHLTIRRLTMELAESNQRMKRDLEAAAELQHALLPDPGLRIGNSSFAWTYRPCDELAGDSLDVFKFDDRYVGLYVLDVSGHGVPASLLAVSLTQSLLPRDGSASIVTAPDGAIVSPALVATQLNERHPMTEQADRYFTLCYGVLDTQSGLFRFVCAGHAGPILVRDGEAVEVSHERDFPVGLMPHTQYQESLIELHPGDRMYLHSDGLIEETNPADDDFGRERLHAALCEANHTPLKDSIDSTVEALLAWHEGDKPTDDLTVVAVEYAG